MPWSCKLATLIRSVADLSRRIRARRRSLGMTQEECAALCGVGPRFVREVEAGKETCQLGRVLRLVEGLGLRVELDER